MTLEELEALLVLNIDLIGVHIEKCIALDNIPDKAERDSKWDGMSRYQIPIEWVLNAGVKFQDEYGTDLQSFVIRFSNLYLSHIGQSIARVRSELMGYIVTIINESDTEIAN